ncbi:MAG TPA: DUF262 domain-containing protein [Phycisphaerae bacterium]|nr:DUF262 domain-containing protein [Phycisphaerae bacterium]
MATPKRTPKDIEALYDKIPRVAQERSDFLLPQIVDFVQSKKWINIRPEYQRRLVWDRKKKSRFIESLLMNIPIPPIFLYEHELSRYEVMDGQQRVNTVLEFYDNALKLTGLETWESLNGLTRRDCPEKILRGLDRRRLSATVLLAESMVASPDAASRIRREVFERLNTGGLQLNAQELRNSLYGGIFNRLLIDLAGNALFDDIWGIPQYDKHYNRETGQIGAELAKNDLFKRMIDCEIVLRFFAFREPSNIRGSVKSMLDRCMELNRNNDAKQIAELKSDFICALETAHAVFGKHTFKIKGKHGWKPSRPLFDAVMVSIDKLREHKEALVDAREDIAKVLQAQLEKEASYEVIVGRPNTAASVKERIALVHRILKGAVHGRKRS